MVQIVTRLLLASSVLLGLVAAGPVRLSREDLAVRALGHLLGRGSQFITGPCTSDSDCAAGCCGFNTGKCAGPIVALQRDGGCGFGDAKPNDNAAQKLGFTGGITSASTGPAGGQANTGSADTSANDSASSSSSSQTTGTSSSAGSGKAPGTQFITGPCASDSECASGCCGFNTGKCAGAIIALQRDGGCGFGDAKANDDAAQKLGLTGGITSPSTGPQNAGATSTTAGDNDTSSDNTSDGDDSSSSAAPPAATSSSSTSGNFKVANGQQAQAENDKFANLTADSACTDGDNACLGDSFAKCANGKFVEMPCNTGLVCKSLPLVNSPGTSITCTTEADAEARIQTALNS